MNPNQPLKGRTILDCSTLLPGPFVGRMLADRGARVIKVENPDRPDGARNMGGHYEFLNSDKELRWLNLTNPEARSEFEELVREADGLIEGFRPKAKLKLGLDEASLHRINPRLCILSLIGYPEDGPWRDRAGHDLNFEAVTGALSLFEGMPGLPLADLFCSYEAAFALVSELDSMARGRSAGRRVVISMSEAITRAQGQFIHEYRRTGEVPAYGRTFVTGELPSYRIYECADGRRVAVGALEEKFWNRVCRILDLPQHEGRGLLKGKEADGVIRDVEAAFARFPWKHWEPLFEEADCCVEPVLNYDEVHR